MMFASLTGLFKRVSRRRAALRRVRARGPFDSTMLGAGQRGKAQAPADLPGPRVNTGDLPICLRRAHAPHFPAPFVETASSVKFVHPTAHDNAWGLSFHTALRVVSVFFRCGLRKQKAGRALHPFRLCYLQMLKTKGAIDVTAPNRIYLSFALSIAMPAGIETTAVPAAVSIQLVCMFKSWFH